jgi:hypothetical protein
LLDYGCIYMYVIVGIWTYGELPCHQRLGPTGGSQKLMEACRWR